MRLDKEYQGYLRGECKNYNQSLIGALGSMEKGGKKNMKHNNKLCVQCGGVRLSGSPLCKNCLIALVNTYAPAHDIAEARINELKEKNKKLKTLCDRLLDHITDSVIHTDELEMEAYLAWLQKKRRGSYEKNRVFEDCEK